MLSYKTFGSFAHPPLLFLHGFLGCKEDWNAVASLLQNEFYCICIDLPGHGESREHTWENNVFSFIQKKFAFEKVSLVGYSMGGRIAMHLKEMYPETIESMILLSSHVGLQEEEKKERKSWEKAWEASLQEDPFSVFLEKWYNQPLFSSLKQNEIVWKTVTERRKNNNPSSLLTLFQRFSLSLQKKFQVFPNTLFLYGEKDVKYKELYAKLSEINQEEVPYSGHCAHLENPSFVAEKIRSHAFISLNKKSTLA